MKTNEDSVLTVDAQDFVAHYLGEEGCRITYVGNELPAECVAAPVECLGRRAAKPF